MMMSGAKDKFNNMGNDLIDVKLVQRLQKQFCKANNIYLGCMSRDQSYVTEPYGSEEEITFLECMLDIEECKDNQEKSCLLLR